MTGVCPAPPESVYGVLGHPVAQSMSPGLHAWAFAHNGLAARYTAWDIPPGELAAFMRVFREAPYAGASVTIPHKESVIPYLDGLTATAKTVRAVNTLFWKDGRLMGHNTDMEGFLAPLTGLAAPETIDASDSRVTAGESSPAPIWRQGFEDKFLPGIPCPETALVLGAGGAARAVVAALAALGVPRVIIAARTPARAETLAGDFNTASSAVTACSWEERLLPVPGEGGGFWVVNTTPIGMRGKAEGESPLPGAWFAARAPERCLAYDLVYNPLETAFLALAKNAGWRFRDGLDMFVAQAAAQFRLWTGSAMPEARARALLAGRLTARENAA